MATHHNEILTTVKPTLNVENVENNTSYPNTILWTCGVAGGFGDIEHFIDIANPNTIQTLPSLTSFNHVRLLMCHENLFAAARSKLKKANMQDTLIFSFNEQTLSSVPARIRTFISEHFDYAKIALAFNISTPTFAVILKNFIKFPTSIPVINIAEHGSSSFLGKEQDILFCSSPAYKRWSMGFAQNQCDVMIKPETKISCEKTLINEEALIKIADSKFLKQLFNFFCTSQTIEFEKNSKCFAQFLQHSLLVPAYCQTGSKAFAAQVQGICASEIIKTSSYKEIIFCVNAGNADIKDFHNEYLQEHGVSCVDIWNFSAHQSQSETQHEMQNVTQHETQNVTQHVLTSRETMGLNNKGIRVKIIQGYFLNDSDYSLFLNSAQLFRLCSGDKSLEQGLGSNAIPLYLARHYKLDVLHGLKQIFCLLDPSYHYPLFDALQQTTTILDKKELLEVANSIASCLTKELYSHWFKTVTELRKSYNFFNHWPKIVEHSLTYAELCRLEQDKKDRSEFCDTNSTSTSARTSTSAPTSTTASTSTSTSTSTSATAISSTSSSSSSSAAATTHSLKQKLASLEQQVNMHREKQFTIYINRLTAEGAESLDLSFEYFTESQFSRILSLIRTMDNLLALKISSCSATLKRNFSQFLTAIAHHSSLKILFLDDNHLDNQEIEALCDILLTIPTLLNVNLNSNHISNVDPIINAMQRHPSLLHVSLEKNQIKLQQANQIVRSVFPIKNFVPCLFDARTKAMFGIFDNVSFQAKDRDKKSKADTVLDNSIEVLSQLKKIQVKAIEPSVFVFQKDKHLADVESRKGKSCNLIFFQYLGKIGNAFRACCSKSAKIKSSKNN